MDALGVAGEVVNPDLAEVELSELSGQPLEAHHQPGRCRAAKLSNQIIDRRFAALVASLSQPVEQFNGGKVPVLLEPLLERGPEVLDRARSPNPSLRRHSRPIQPLYRRLLGDARHTSLRYSGLLGHLPMTEAGCQKDLYLVSLDHRDHLHPLRFGGLIPRSDIAECSVSTQMTPGARISGRGWGRFSGTDTKPVRRLWTDGPRGRPRLEIGERAIFFLSYSVG